MFIQTEATPNPATLKFIPGKPVLPNDTRDYRDQAQAEESPLASRLFQVSGVTGVFFGTDFVTITKDETDWQHLKPAVLGVIMEHFTTGAPVMNGAGVAEAANADDDDEVVSQIRELINTRVRPAVI